MSGTDGNMRVEETLRDLWSSRPRRPRADRKIAGVAAAIGNRYAIDPVVIRVALVVTAVYGGIGLIAYLLGWLLLRGPEDEVSPLEALIGRGRSSTGKFLTLLLLFALLPAFGWAVTTFIGGIFALVLIIAGAFLLHRTRGGLTGAAAPRATGFPPPMPPFPAPEPPMTTAQPGPPDQPTMDLGQTQHLSTPHEQVTAHLGTPQAPVQETAAHGAEAPATATPADATPGDETTTKATPTDVTPGDETPTTVTPVAAPVRVAEPPRATFPPVTYPAQFGTPPQWDPLGAAPFAWDLPEPRREAELEPEPEPKRKTRVTAVTLALAFIVGSVTGILAGLVPWFTAPHVLGMVVAVLAVGALVGAFRGGGRLLVVLGFPVAIVAIGLTAAQNRTIPQVFGSVDTKVTSVTQLQPNYRVDVGQITLDLSGLDLSKERGTVSTSVVVGAGDATVVLPKDVDVDLTCRAGRMGSAQCLDNIRTGGGEIKVEDNGLDGPAGGKLRLRVEVQGPGNVEVHRVG